MKTSELTGAALDWAVAKCEGATQDALEIYADGLREADDGNYSANWAQGGPIIEREKIHLFQQEILEPEWTASLPRYRKVGWRLIQYGPTPLIAAMRCYVASKLGDEVEIPKELL